MSKTAVVTIDADENRVVWQVLVYENERCVEMRPFRDRQDAEEYAALFDKEKDEVYTMNERIRELVEESGLYIAYDNRNVTDKELESFAELIVQECISTIENAENGYQDYRNQIEDGMRNHCIDLIKNKFGVQE